VTVGLVVVFAVVGSLRLHKAKAVISPSEMNLHIIQLAKLEWMSENHKTTNDTPTWDDLRSYLHSSAGLYGWPNDRPICPQGGTYTLGRVEDRPRCSIGGPDHSLTKDW
jgi:hypothetical protein